jgi:SAM-dependent methyltransferase
MMICDAVDYAVFLKNDAFFQYTIPNPLPLPENSRDFILNSAVIQHLNNFQEVQGLIQEVHRVLKPGGIFCLSFKEGYHETNTTVYDLRWKRYRTFLVFDRKVTDMF